LEISVHAAALSQRDMICTTVFLELWRLDEQALLPAVGVMAAWANAVSL
jgi:hypothetical protein